MTNYKYFIYYRFEGRSVLGSGNTIINIPYKIDNLDHLRQVEEMVKSNSKSTEICIANFILMDTTNQEEPIHNIVQGPL